MPRSIINMLQLKMMALFLLLLLSATSNKAFSSKQIRLEGFYGASVHKTMEEYAISGVVSYMGSQIFESFYVNWQVDTMQVYSEHFDSININPNILFEYQMEHSWLPEEQGKYELKIWYSGLNGNDPGITASDTIHRVVEVLPDLPQKQMALLESFSSINCGSCAIVAPVLREMIDKDPEKYAMIYYHPMSHEQSPLYLFNPKDQDSRRDFYEVFFTPYAVIGDVYQGVSQNVDPGLLHIDQQRWAGFTLGGHWHVMEDLLHFSVEGDILVALDNPDKDYRLLIAATQDTVAFDSPPGTNGESEFHDVMRFLAPDANGVRLTANSFSESFHLGLSTPFHPELDTTKISLTAFIQEMNTGEIHQAARLEHQQPDPTFAPHTQVNNKAYQVFPNPASTQFTILPTGSNRVDRIRIYDIQGRSWLSLEQPGKTIDIRQIPSGLYLIVLEADGAYHRKKISVIR